MVSASLFHRGNQFGAPSFRNAAAQRGGKILLFLE